MFSSGHTDAPSFMKSSNVQSILKSKPKSKQKSKQKSTQKSTQKSKKKTSKTKQSSTSRANSIRMNVCKNNICTAAFAKSSRAAVKTFFRNFTDFELVAGIKDDANVLVYRFGDYTAFAHLRAISDPREYHAGKWISGNISPLTPVFADTYAAFTILSSFPRTPHELKTQLTILNDNDTDAFAHGGGHQIALLSEFVDPKYQHRHWHECGKNGHEIAAVLFQVFASLAYFKDAFAHNHLSTNTCLLVRAFAPDSQLYVHIKYHFTQGKKIDFYSRFIPRITDFERVYFPGSDASVSRRKPNSSQDLSLLRDVAKRKYNLEITEMVHKMLHFEDGVPRTRLRDGHLFPDKSIFDVSDAAETLQMMMYSHLNKESFLNAFADHSIGAEMNVYLDDANAKKSCTFRYI